MEITRDNVRSISNMEISQIMGTLWMLKNAPEAQAFVKEGKELDIAYFLIYDENLRRFGIDAVGKLLTQLQGAIDMRKKAANMKAQPNTDPKPEDFYVIVNSENDKEYLHPASQNQKDPNFIYKDTFIGAAGFIKEMAEDLAVKCNPKGIAKRIADIPEYAALTKNRKS